MSYPFFVPGAAIGIVVLVRNPGPDSPVGPNCTMESWWTAMTA